MKPVFALILSLAVAAPALQIPTTADAQVRVGAGAPRRTPPRPRPRLSEAEREQLVAAEDEIDLLEVKISDLESAGEAAGGLTQAQQAERQSHADRKEELQAIVDRLRAKRNG